MVDLTLTSPENQEYVLAGWPEGYRLFDHNKGPANNPRHDVYLFGMSCLFVQVPRAETNRLVALGSQRGRFRSINEFIPHAIWLMRDESMEHATCLCKYCSKKAQKEITASMSGILRSSPTSQSPSPSRVKSIRERRQRQTVSTRPRDRLRDTKTYAAVQKRPEVTKQAMLVERNSDLRAIFSQTDMKLKRWFREGELVWCALDRSISGQGQLEDAAIRCWPAIVDEARLKSHAVSRNGVSDLKTDDEAPWMVQQYYVYKVHLLIVDKIMVVPDEKILPYQAHVPPAELISILQGYPPDELDFSREAMRKFDPCGDPVDFSHAVAPYAMAIQIGAALSSFWCLTDEWTTTFTVPRRHSLPPEPSLPDVIDKAHRHNAQITNMEGSSSMSTAPRRNDIRLPEPGAQISQLRFQGLWWGGERIWADDFVRLKVPRSSLAPQGAENVYLPAGPGKSAKEIWTQQGRDPSELGANSRGIFMRLDGLIIVDVTQPDGKLKKECRACGMLYELADMDWEDPDSAVQNGGPSSGSSAAAAPYANGSARQTSTVTAPVPAPLYSSGTESLSVQNTATESAQPVFKPRYPLPEAPEGYRFRGILPEGHEAIISMSLISGRYYPRILSHPLLDQTLRKALTRPPEHGGLLDSNNLWALEGLCAGFYNSVDPTQYKGTRKVMLEDADRVAREQLEDYATRQGEEEFANAMDIDGYE